MLQRRPGGAFKSSPSAQTPAELGHSGNKYFRPDNEEGGGPTVTRNRRRAGGERLQTGRRGWDRERSKVRLIPT